MWPKWDHPTARWICSDGELFVTQAAAKCNQSFIDSSPQAYNQRLKEEEAKPMITKREYTVARYVDGFGYAHPSEEGAKHNDMKLRLCNAGMNGGKVNEFIFTLREWSKCHPDKRTMLAALEAAVNTWYSHAKEIKD